MKWEEGGKERQIFLILGIDEKQVWPQPFYESVRFN